MNNRINILGVEYVVSFDDETIYNSFLKQSNAYSFVNKIKSVDGRYVSLRFTDDLDDFLILLSKKNYEYAQKYTFDTGKAYLFRIKEFLVFLETKKDCKLA